MKRETRTRPHPFLSLNVQQGFDPAFIGWEHQRVMHQIALLLGCLFRQNMTVEGVLPLDFSGAGELETLLGTRIGFYFWHCCKTAFVEI